jgi:tRNA(adenine34) deaminase
MKIEPSHSKMTRISSKKIRIDSYNFYPYLEATKKLKLDTKIICKKVGEPSIQKMCEMIHPKLKFSRNYDNIRPHNKKYCEEYIEIKK